MRAKEDCPRETCHRIVLKRLKACGVDGWMDGWMGGRLGGWAAGRRAAGWMDGEKLLRWHGTKMARIGISDGEVNTYQNEHSK